jgi:hypothetical protein
LRARERPAGPLASGSTAPGPDIPARADLFARSSLRSLRIEALTQDRYDRCLNLACKPGFLKPCACLKFSYAAAYKNTEDRTWLMILISLQPVVSCVVFSSSSLIRSWPHLLPPRACVGKVLPAYTLYHKHHAVVLLIPSTTPPHLARPRRRSHRCDVCVHRLEAPPIVALGLDRIMRRRC